MLLSSIDDPHIGQSIEHNQIRNAKHTKKNIRNTIHGYRYTLVNMHNRKIHGTVNIVVSLQAIEDQSISIGC